jgi:hypothetical protein
MAPREETLGMSRAVSWVVVWLGVLLRYLWLLGQLYCKAASQLFACIFRECAGDGRDVVHALEVLQGGLFSLTLEGVHRHLESLLVSVHGLLVCSLFSVRYGD